MLKFIYQNIRFRTETTALLFFFNGDYCTKLAHMSRTSCLNWKAHVGTEIYVSWSTSQIILQQPVELWLLFAVHYDGKLLQIYPTVFVKISLFNHILNIFLKWYLELIYPSVQCMYIYVVCSVLI